MLTLLSVITICLTLLLLVGVIMLARRLAGQRRQLDESQQRIMRLERELSAVNNAAIGVGQRLMALEKRVRHDQEMQTSQRSMPAPGDDYRHAEQLAQGGAVVAELMQQCGLSEAEAQLMSRLKARNEADVS